MHAHTNALGMAAGIQLVDGVTGPSECFGGGDLYVFVCMCMGFVSLSHSFSNPRSVPWMHWWSQCEWRASVSCGGSLLFRISELLLIMPHCLLV